MRLNSTVKQKQLELQSGITDFGELENLFRSHGVKTIYVKHLARRQDNEKNQVVLASAGAKNILTMFPAALAYRSASMSKMKRHSLAGMPKVEMIPDFYWIDKKGEAHSAPGAKIINYFQYPEVRFSGFLKGCREHAPDALRRDRQRLYGRRILVIGSNSARRMFGVVLTEREDPLASEFPELPASKVVPLLFKHDLGVPIGDTGRQRLLKELSGLCGTWHPSIILKPGNTRPVAFKGNQGAGFTLEALLGIPANAEKEPDKHGFELKSFKRGGKISLMTPTADAGFEGEHTFREFMAAYGWKSDKPDGRIVFNGIFRFATPNQRRPGKRFVLGLDGYDSASTSFDVSGEICVTLHDADSGVLVSGWTLDKLLSSWNKKHSQACYVEYEKRPYQGTSVGHDAEYRFTGRVLVCEGTSVWEYLTSIAGKTVYYDPAHEIKAEKPHVRPQWRISVNKKLRMSLEALYDAVTEENLLDQST